MNKLAVAALLLGSLLYCDDAVSQFNRGDDVWSDIRESAISPSGERQIMPMSYRTVALDMNALLLLLTQAPMENRGNVRASSLVLGLPLPDNSFGRFRVVESPIMAPELSEKYPEIRTYVGQGIDDATATVRFDVTPAGFHAIILSENPTVYIDPYSRGNTRHYISYFKRSVPFDESKRFDEIGVEGRDSEAAREIARIVSTGRMRAIGEQLRTYRLALASTGEYTAFHGGTVADGLAAMVTAMNRVNGIYEREVAVRMVLIANNDQLVYTNPATDPYTNSSGFTMLGQNQSNLDAVIGNVNYDVGHVFSTGGGGVAGLGVICRTGSKARGVTGLPGPIGDPFYVDYVAHEMGHQFGGNHSFNGNAGSCAGGNRNGSTAYEPGSGTTVMAYAGICNPQNTQDNSDDVFHGVSIDEIVAYTTVGAGNSCPVITATGNNPPTVSVSPPGITIPLGTPFFLNGSAIDPDGDTLTYTWEELDLGPSGHPNTPSGSAPIFRSFKGTRNPIRTFPRMQDIVGNTQTIGEILPSYARTLNFRLTVRDNRAGGGGVGKNSTNVVVSGAGPFFVTSPNGGGSWRTNSIDTVTWDVASTNLPPVNCANVNILLSTDGGGSFATTLVSNTPNDGAETITVPDILTESARIKIEAVGNIFFDISNADFALARVASPVLVAPANNATNVPTALTVRWRGVPTSAAYHIQLARDISFTSPVVNDSTLTDTTRAITGLINNVQYFWRAKARNNLGESSGWSETRNFRTIIAPPRAPTLSSPANNAVNVPPSLTFQWNPVIFATGYRLEVGRDSLFALIVIDDSTVTTIQRNASLAPATSYYWRVRARNAGGSSDASTVWSFATQQIPAQVVLVSPPNDTVISENRAVFVWRRVAEGERYWFELSPDSIFSSGIIDSTLVDTTRIVFPLISSNRVWWRVRAGNLAGWGPFSETRRFEQVIVAVNELFELPKELVVSRNYPNPFNPSTTITISLPTQTDFTLTIYDVLGKEVKTFIYEKAAAGTHDVVWDGTNEGGEHVASGVYLYRFRSGGYVAVNKLMLAR